MKKGFTLLETTVALGIAVLVIMICMNVMSFVTRGTEGFLEKQMLHSQITIALDSLLVHIREAQEIEITYENEDAGLLNRIDLISDEGRRHRIFKYRPDTPPYDRLMFGGENVGEGWQELARRVSGVYIRVDTSSELMYVTVTTQKDEVESQSVTRTISIDIKNKVIKVK